MPTVDCKLADCNKHGRDICIAKRISVDEVGMVECYEPVPRSSIVHGHQATDLYRRHGRLTQKKGNVLK